MSNSKEALEDALGGKESSVDWTQYGSVEDFDPTEGIRSKRGRKPSGKVREHANSEFVETAEDEAILESIGQPLHNLSLPEHRIQQEKSDHRFLVYLFAQGKGVKDVFLQLGGKWDDVNGRPLPTKQHGGKYSYAHITQIRRQPWFQSQVLEIMKSEGMCIVEATFKNEFENSVQVVIDVRDNADEKGSTRIAAANSLLDRFLGKPTQHIKSENTTRTLSDIAEDKTELERELEIVEAEIISMSPQPVRKLNE